MMMPLDTVAEVSTGFPFRKKVEAEERGDIVLVQITVSNTRSRATKQALYRAIVAELAKDPGVKPEDVIINLVEVLPENWSFGNGIAQYVADQG